MFNYFISCCNLQLTTSTAKSSRTPSRCTRTSRRWSWPRALAKTSTPRLRLRWKFALLVGTTTPTTESQVTNHRRSCRRTKATYGWLFTCRDSKSWDAGKNLAKELRSRASNGRIYRHSVTAKTASWSIRESMGSGASLSCAWIKESERVLSFTFVFFLDECVVARGNIKCNWRLYFLFLWKCIKRNFFRSYFAFKLTSLHHQFYLRMRTEMTCLQSLAKGNTCREFLITSLITI